LLSRPPNFASGGLKLDSFARPGHLFTAHRGIVLYSAGKLRPEAMKRVADRLVAIRDALSGVPKVLAPGLSERVDSRRLPRGSGTRVPRPTIVALVRVRVCEDCHQVLLHPGMASERATAQGALGWCAHHFTLSFSRKSVDQRSGSGRYAVTRIARESVAAYAHTA
jgi:hypothetical protein